MLFHTHGQRGGEAPLCSGSALLSQYGYGKALQSDEHPSQCMILASVLQKPSVLDTARHLSSLNFLNQMKHIVLTGLTDGKVRRVSKIK